MKKIIFIMLVALGTLTGCLNGDSADKEQNGEEAIEQGDQKEQGEQKEQDKEQDSQGDETATDKEITNGTDDTSEPTPSANTPNAVAQDVVAALQAQDMQALSGYVHPSNGVRFSPYSYIDVQGHQVFTATQVQGLFNDTTVYHWGEYDGTGDPIDLTFVDYFDRFVYDQDYANPEQMAVNTRLGQGSSLDNSASIYPNSTIIDFHFSGFDPQYNGMDWRSLRIVLEEVGNQWYVVGIIHDEWTT